MNKEEFLNVLKMQLSGQLHEGTAAAHVQYYRNYIEEQMRKGRIETEILAELGDPRLIAKTLVDTNSSASETEYASYSEGNYTYEGYQDSWQQGQVEKQRNRLDLTTWYGKLIVILIAVAVIVGLLILIGTILPFLIGLVVILFLFSKLKK